MSIARNLDTVREAVQKAESASGRTAGSVKLLAVSKFHPAESVIEAVRAGQTLFGENRVQEAAEKFARVNEILVTEKPLPELHIIGALQRNKVKSALAVSHCVQSVDRIELLDEIQKHARALGAKISVFFEIRTGEKSKSGFDSEEKLAECIQSASSMSHIECAGFMTIAPFTEDVRVIRTSFSECAETARKMRKLFPALPLAELSMGMSGDFTIAIEEGSTMVRIGTAIFGSRDSGGTP
ncbi:MAG: YggS family pyridoxal phosphate-dependent enzyme [Treponemataceae bacterium]|nr:MAG: YggS family pyridoxal phosphate-dependent enzyme [Treponemataceae bacterium]